MRFKHHVEIIRKAMAAFKGTIDALEKDYIRKKADVDETIKANAGNWTQKYQDEYRTKHSPRSSVYTENIKSAQDAARRIVDGEIHDLNAELDEYFSRPVNPEFAAKVTAISGTGMKMSRREFELLKSSAQSYLELRLLQTLAENRTKTEERVVLKNGEPHRETVQTSDALQLDVPNMDQAYAALGELKRATGGALTYYSGTNSGLADMLPPIGPFGSKIADGLMFAGVGSAFYRNRADEKFTAAMERIISVAPNAGKKTELTDKDRRLIDAIIDREEAEKYPSLIKSKVRKVCNDNPDLVEIFSLDSRYADMVPSEDIYS